MKRFLLLWMPVAVAVLIVLFIGGIFWAVRSESGARWVLARAEPWLPAALSLGDVRGTLVDGVTFDRASWRDARTSVDVTSLFVHAELRPLLRGQVNIHRLDAAAVDVAVQPGEDGDSSEPALPVFSSPVDIDVEAASIRNLTVERPGSDLVVNTVDLGGKLDGDELTLTSFSAVGENFRFDLSGDTAFRSPHPATVALDWAWRLADGTELAGRLALAGDARGYEVNHTLRQPAVVESAGTIRGLPNQPTADLTSTWATLGWPLGEPTVTARDATLRVSGWLTGYDLEFTGEVEQAGWPPGAVSLAGSGNLQSLDFRQLDVAAEPGRLQADGRIAWLPALAIESRYRLEDVNLALLETLTRVPDLQGTVDGTGEVAFRMVDGAPAFELQVALLDGTLRGLPVEGSGRFDYAAGELGITDGAMSVGANRATVSGTIGAALDLDADFDLPNIAALAPEARGSLRGTASLEGTAEAIAGELQATGAELAYGGLAARRLAVELETDATGAGDLDLGLEGATINGREADSIRVTGSGSLERHSLDALLAAAGIEVQATLSGGYREAGWLGDVERLRVAGEALGTWAGDGPVPLRIGRDGTGLERICLTADAGRTCVAATYAPGGPAGLEILITGLPLAGLPLSLPAGVTAEGTLAGRATLTFGDGLLNGAASAAVAGLTFRSEIEGETLDLEFPEALMSAGVENNRVQGALRIVSSDGRARVDANGVLDNLFDTNAPAAGQGRLAIDSLAPFAALVPEVGSLEGRMAGDVRLGGSLAAPSLTGELSLLDGAFQVRRAGIRVTEVQATVSQRVPGALDISGTGRSGEGTVTITGSTRLGTDTGIRSDIAIDGRDFQLVQLPGWDIAASPDIDIVFDDRVTAVSGSLEIPRAEIAIRTLPETAVTASPDAVVHEAGVDPSAQQRRRVTVDVDTQLSDSVSFTGFGLTGDIAGGVRLRGGTDMPTTGQGRLTLSNGRYKAYGQELTIERGELVFNGSLTDPALDVRATRQAGDVTAGILLSGTPSGLRSTVFTEPATNDADALSYLLTGRPLTGVESGAEGDVLNKAAFALGLSGAGTVTSQIRSSLGLETLSVEGGADDGRIIAGKRIGSRLLVEYGYGLIDKLGTLLLRYQLSERLVLESRTGTVSNLDLVYSVKKQ